MKQFNRRDFVATTLGAAAASAALGPLAGAKETGGQQKKPAGAAQLNKPNVLFIAIDDLNSWIGALKNLPGAKVEVHTPNIDRLAKRGILFSQAHCQAPICNPSRASLMTGVRPSTSGVYMNTQLWRKAMPDAVTLPQQFMANGYEVMGSGKIFHGNQNDEASWNTYYVAQRDKHGLGATEEDEDVEGAAGKKIEGMTNVAQIRWAAIDDPDEETSDWQVANWAVKQLEKKHDRPFFLGCGLFRPHLPLVVPRKYFNMYPAGSVTPPETNVHDLDDIPVIGKKLARAQQAQRVATSGRWADAVAAYLACISYADARVGELIDALDRSQYAKNTIVVLWADHGWSLGQKQHWEKFALWEECTHVPLMFVAPGVTPENATCDRVVSLIDIYPTLMELAGLKARPAALEGTSLMPLIKDPKREWDRPAVTTYGHMNHAVRSERFRYIRYMDGTEELYDRSVDKLEWTNLADNPQFNEVKKDLGKWLPQVNHPGAPWSEKGPPKRMEDLVS
jgi:arylsulfatase A-like enzyme